MVAEVDLNYVSFVDPSDSERILEVAAMWEMYLKMYSYSGDEEYQE